MGYDITVLQNVPLLVHENCEDCLEPFENEPVYESSKTTSNTSLVSWERFYQLDKEIGILGTKMEAVKVAIKDLCRDTKDLSKKINTDIKDFRKKVNSKFDWLMYLVVGVIPTGLDVD
ncbi:hypothetical protein DFH27DRAFT_527052 [Peziza echinospora]|nr:hypothetical protein DFH27DRAFT_527052 [Peziza echinospora]